MTPPAGPGQIAVLQQHYTKMGEGYVGFIDETYHVENDGRNRFYTMSAVVLAARDLDPLRRDLDTIVPGGYWHTSQQLRTEQGRDDAHALLATLESSYDACVVVDHVSLGDTDSDGLSARSEVMRQLLVALHRGEGLMHGPVQLAVAEENRVARVNNLDRATRQTLVSAGVLPDTVGLVHASPGSEHLLWLPDVVCSDYRQDKLGRGTDLFDEIRNLTDVIQLPRKTYGQHGDRDVSLSSHRLPLLPHGCERGWPPV